MLYSIFFLLPIFYEALEIKECTFVAEHKLVFALKFINVI